MKKNFDLVAIGTGSRATAAASKCRAVGWQVAIVDSRPGRVEIFVRPQ